MPQDSLSSHTVISKEKFIACIRNIENEIRFDEELTKLYSSYGGIPPHISPDCICMFVDLLDDLMSPEERLVCYFCFQLDFGKNSAYNDYEVDGNIIDLSTAEKLYDYLVNKK